MVFASYGFPSCIGSSIISRLLPNQPASSSKPQNNPWKRLGLMCRMIPNWVGSEVKRGRSKGSYLGRGRHTDTWRLGELLAHGSDHQRTGSAKDPAQPQQARQHADADDSDDDDEDDEDDEDDAAKARVRLPRRD